MDGEGRRKELLNILIGANGPVSGDKLAAMLGVSRQVIVQDIALLRASDKMILSTNRGYLIYPMGFESVSRIFQVSHTTDEIRDELNIIVDSGGFVKNVMVDHDVYGVIQADLSLASRRDVEHFVKRVEESQAIPLKALGGDVHSHTVLADSNEVLDEIEDALRVKGYLIKIV